LTEPFRLRSTVTAEQSLATRVEEAKRCGSALQRASDELSAKLARLESVMCELSLGVAISVPLDAEGTELSFRRAGSHWGLFVDFADDRRPVALQFAPQGLLLAAADSCHQLVEELVRRMAEEVSSVRARVAKVDALLSALHVDREPDSVVRSLPC
jgi:hypothetical protein